ncbi:MAG: TIGR01620 family protein, partial [Rubricella sp.]
LREERGWRIGANLEARWTECLVGAGGRRVRGRLGFARALDARAAAARVLSLYRRRPETRRARDEIARREADILDADALLSLTEREVLGPLDRAAQEEIRGAARQVAAATAIIPLALADVFVALTVNLRMIRRIAELYGGRAGVLGSWRLFRSVAAHLVATGAVAVGDDLIGSVVGGGVVARVSRRFGEGVVNGALTARVGVAAMEVCRPMPFTALKRPAVTELVRTALSGLFRGQRGEEDQR